jgi:DNA-3-methyladenine glycosylase II
MAKKNSRPYAHAERHLSRKVPELREVISSVGPCTLRPQGGDPFGMLVRAIVAQQISAKAAMSISDRLATFCGKPGLHPAAILRAKEEGLRGCGLSQAKFLSIRSLAEHFTAQPKAFHQIDELPDEEIAERLLPIRGIGPWTVQMFLIFVLGRLDVLPVADFGLRAGVRSIFGLKELPVATELLEMAEPWRPYRTIGTWYCWKYRGPVPSS